MQKGQMIEVSAAGTVLFSLDHPRSSPDGINGWYDPSADSPFKQNVGGLEFAIGSLSSNRYFAGTHYKGVAPESGELIFRVIDRKEGYGEKNAGGFKVEVKR